MCEIMRAIRRDNLEGKSSEDNLGLGKANSEVAKSLIDGLGYVDKGENMCKS